MTHTETPVVGVRAPDPRRRPARAPVGQADQARQDLRRDGRARRLSRTARGSTPRASSRSWGRRRRKGTLLHFRAKAATPTRRSARSSSSSSAISTRMRARCRHALKRVSAAGRPPPASRPGPLVALGTAAVDARAPAAIPRGKRARARAPQSTQAAAAARRTGRAEPTTTAAGILDFQIALLEDDALTGAGLCRDRRRRSRRRAWRDALDDADRRLSRPPRTSISAPAPPISRDLRDRVLRAARRRQRGTPRLSPPARIVARRRPAAVALSRDRLARGGGDRAVRRQPAPAMSRCWPARAACR